MTYLKKVSKERYASATAEPPVIIDPPAKESTSTPNVTIDNEEPTQSGGPLNVSRNQGTVLVLYFLILGIRIMESQRLGNAFGLIFSNLKGANNAK